MQSALGRLMVWNEFRWCASIFGDAVVLPLGDSPYFLSISFDGDKSMTHVQPDGWTEVWRSKGLP